MKVTVMQQKEIHTIKVTLAVTVETEPQELSQDQVLAMITVLVNQCSDDGEPVG